MGGSARGGAGRGAGGGRGGRRVPGAIGRGYLPKGGAPVAARMAREAGKSLDWSEHRAQQAAGGAAGGAAAGAGAGSESGLSTGGARAAARSRGGRALTVEGLALIGAVSGGSSLLGLIAHLVWG